MSSAPAALLDLVERFDRHIDAYRSGRYNETQVRREFIDPLFICLGWDVNNERGYAEAYKDVVHEDAIKIGGATKAPDYCFRVGGTRKFFVEAKKPSVNVGEDVSAAYQLRRYAWSAKLPLSILTDFEELAVYDCRVKPARADGPATARIMHLNYRDYAARWAEIADVFAKEAVLQGSFDRFAASNARKRGTAGVDDAFLEEIDAWREQLARNLALRNPDLTSRQLNDAVQRTIDRIIFLRIAEDRGIEPYGRLMALLNGGDVYARLCDLYRQADERYNSGLFHFTQEQARSEPPDDLTPHLRLDDRVLKDMVRGLYYPDSPYEFSVLPADILGQVYERFLGKVIRLTPGHQARVDVKPEVKKAGGVFYTPTYIVEYIVEHTLGPLLKDKTVRQVGGEHRGAPLRVVDPACGSGSFLLGAYQYLLDWYRDQYVADGPEKWAAGARPRLYQGHEGEWYLTTAERRRILLNHIYGVDIDPQAVEVTKLSLLLKVLEGESGQRLATQLAFMHERALPDLGSNIKCGNSLIGSDYYHGRQMAFLDEEERYRVNPFDWDVEFADIMAAGGFDAVIGNPPYIRIQTLKEWAPQEVEFYKERYVSASKGNYDIYVVFVERGLGLLNPNGRLGFILPHKFFNARYGEPLRGLLAQGRHLAEVVHFGDQQVFPGATTYTCLMFLAKVPQEDFMIARVRDLPAWQTDRVAEHGALPTASLGAGEWDMVVGAGADLYRRLSSLPTLGDYASRLYQGCITGADKVMLFERFRGCDDGMCEVYSQALAQWVIIERGILRPVVRSGGIGRYHASVGATVIFPYEIQGDTARLLAPSEIAECFPQAYAYLHANRKELQQRERGKLRGEGWYRYSRNQNLGMWERPKIMVPYMVTRLSAYLDDTARYYFINVTTGGYGITVNDRPESLSYLCGLLNSKLLNFYFKRVTTSFHGGYSAANRQYIEQLPIRTIDFTDPTDVARHDRMVSLVEAMLALHQQLAAARTPSDKTLLQRQIDATDREIDALVYELYDLTPEEIRIVEEETRRA